jgi:hypothetical protein
MPVEAPPWENPTAAWTGLPPSERPRVSMVSRNHMYLLVLSRFSHQARRSMLVWRSCSSIMVSFRDIGASGKMNSMPPGIFLSFVAEEIDLCVA